jgi:hypothetical protein
MITYSDITTKDRLCIAIVIKDSSGEIESFIIETLDNLKIPWTSVDICGDEFISIVPSDYYALPQGFVDWVYGNLGFFLIYLKRNHDIHAMYNQVSSSNIWRNLDKAKDMLQFLNSPTKEGFFRYIDKHGLVNSSIGLDPDITDELFCSLVLGLYDGMDECVRKELENSVQESMKKHENRFRGKALKILY